MAQAGMEFPEGSTTGPTVVAQFRVKVKDQQEMEIGTTGRGRRSGD